MLQTYFHKIELKFLIGIACVILSPVTPLLILVGFVIFLDLFFGLWKSVKLKRRITSRGLAETLKKMFQYQLIVISMYFLDNFLIGEFVMLFISVELFVTKVVAISLILVELISINENIEFIFKINIFERVTKAVKSFFDIKKSFDKYKDE